MAKDKATTFPEIEDIRDDLESLKSNVVELTRHVQENGVEKTASHLAEQVADKAQKQISKLQVRGKRELHKVERAIKHKPAQSLALAFAAGLVISQMLGRK
jgi:ElaB/YqjD/DUF883 family membrane-anchored ribosome-binding protein